MAKSLEKIKAREYRKNGKSIKEIAALVRVSPSTVSVWCRDIVLTKEQLHILEVRWKDPHYGRRHEYLKKIKKKRIANTQEEMHKGILQVGKLSKRELLISGIALYWAEGFKKDSQMGFANSDPKMILFFIRWVTQCFHCTIYDLSFRITANISHKYRISTIQNYWIKQLNVSETQFQKPYFQKVKWKKKYENENEYYGILRVKVRKSTHRLRRTLGLIEGLRINI